MRKPEQIWCPMSRLSIQKFKPDGSIENSANTGGAFNRVRAVLAHGHEEWRLATPCVGPQCPLYRKSLFSWGYCALANVNAGPWIFLGFVAAAGIIAFCLLP